MGIKKEDLEYSGGEYGTPLHKKKTSTPKEREIKFTDFPAVDKTNEINTRVKELITSSYSNKGVFDLRKVLEEIVLLQMYAEKREDRSWNDIKIRL